VEGVVKVHVPFSLQDLSQIEKRLGSFSTNPSAYAKEFHYLSQAYDLTWHDIFVIMASTLTPEEWEHIRAAARSYADETHLADPTVPVGEDAIPNHDPNWDYQPEAPGHCQRDIMIQCLLQGMDTVSNKVVNCDKLREVTQGANENPALFLNCLQEALTQYTRLDPTSPAGAAILAGHFISQSTLDIRTKLKKAEDGPQTPIQDLVKMAFKVFNAQEEAAESTCQKHLQQKVALQTQALVAALHPAGLQPQVKGGTRNLPSAPLGACFKCGKEGHWARQCPNPRPPTKPCPKRKQVGHWGSDCPGQGSPPTAPHGGSAPPDIQIPDFLRLAED
jgi:hypothetical protein